MSGASDIIALIENDALVSFGQPILTFLTAVESAQADPVKIATAFVKLQGDLVAAAPGALAGLESQIASAIATKLQAKLASLPK